MKKLSFTTNCKMAPKYRFKPFYDEGGYSYMNYTPYETDVEPQRATNERIRFIPFTEKEWIKLQEKLNIKLDGNDYEKFNKIANALKLKENERGINEVAEALNLNYIICDEDTPRFEYEFKDYAIAYAEGDKPTAGSTAWQFDYYAVQQDNGKFVWCEDYEIIE